MPIYETYTIETTTTVTIKTGGGKQVGSFTVHGEGKANPIGKPLAPAIENTIDSMTKTIKEHSWVIQESEAERLSR